jgi:hypothetical protein
MAAQGSTRAQTSVRARFSRRTIRHATKRRKHGPLTHFANYLSLKANIQM